MTSLGDISCVQNLASTADTVSIRKGGLHLQRRLLALILLECSLALGRLESSMSSRLLICIQVRKYSLPPLIFEPLCFNS